MSHLIEVGKRVAVCRYQREAMNTAVFHHLLNHYRAEKCDLRSEIRRYLESSHSLADASTLSIAKHSGALSYLYWQAMDHGLVNFAKGIRRTLVKANAVHGIEGM